MTAAPIRVLIADDEALVRSGLRWTLEASDGIEVVGEAAHGGEAVDEAVRLHPHVVLMDIRMAPVDGITGIRRLLATTGSAAPHVIVLTTFDFEQNVYEALKAGASGFLLKDTPPQRLIEAIRTVVTGEKILAPELTRQLVEHYVSRPRARHARRGELVDLTERELEILEQLARGLSNVEIAEQIGLREATVKTHLSSMFGKLGIKSRIQAVVLAYETGLVEPGSAPPRGA